MKILFILSLLFLSYINTTGTIFKIEPLENKKLTKEDSLIAVSLIQGKDSLQNRSMAQSLELIQASEKFQNIYSNIITKNGEEVFLIKLSSRPKISKIKIKGNHPFLKNDILNNISIYEGSYFNKNTYKDDYSRLKNFYLRDGLILDTVIIDAICNDKDSLDYTINIHLKSDKYQKIDKMKIYGNNFYASWWMKLGMNSYRGSFGPGGLGSFVRNDFDKDIRKQIEKYRKNGFINVKIDAEVTGDLQKNIKININEGFEHKIDFLGNNSFSNRRLKKQLSMPTRGNRQNFSLRSDRNTIENFYKEKGFLNVTVNIKDTIKIDRYDTIQHISFLINEGKRFKIKSLNITGNKSVSDNKIKEYMLSKESSWFINRYYSKKEFKKDVETVGDMYRNEGFLKNKISSKVKIKPSGVYLFVDIKEGDKLTFDSLVVKSDNDIIKKIVQQKAFTKEHKNINEKINKIESIIVDTLVPDGYPLVEQKIDIIINDDSTNYYINANLKASNKKYFGGVFYNGLFSTKHDYLDKKIKLKKGDEFNIYKIFDAKRNFHDFSIFKSVRVKNIGINGDYDSVYTVFEFEEEKPKYFNGSIGYSTEESWALKAKLGTINWLGRNKHIWIGGDYGDIGYRAEVGFSEPRFLNRILTASAVVYKEKKMEINKSFGSDLIGTNISFTKDHGRKFKYGIFQSWEQRTMYGDLTPDSTVVDTAIFYEEIRNRNVLVTSPTIMLDYRNSFIKPTKGWSLDIDYQHSIGLSSKIDNYSKYQIEVKGFVPITSSTTFATFIKHGYVIPRNGIDAVPRDKLFYLGGTSSVRGFEENMLKNDGKDELGGRFSLSGSFEFRQELFLAFEGAVFCDYGILVDGYNEFNFNKIRFSAGLGIRYSTPIGPLSLVVAQNLNPKSNEPPRVIHFSIGYTF